MRGIPLGHSSPPAFAIDTASVGASSFSSEVSHERLVFVLSLASPFNNLFMCNYLIAVGVCSPGGMRV